jgi:hypothetical protein
MGGTARERFAEDVFDGRLRLSGEVLEIGRALGVRFSERVLVTVVIARDARDAFELGSVGERVSARFDGLSAPIRRDPRPHVPMILTDATPVTADVIAELTEAVPSGFIGFVAETAAEEVASQYSTLAEEIELARANGRRIVQPSELRTERVLWEARLPAAAEFVGVILGPVLADRTGAALLSTLEQLLAWNGPLKPFKGIPYSTARGHIDKIETLTGLRMGRPRDRVLLDTAVRLWRLNEETLPEMGEKWRDLAAGG